MAVFTQANASNRSFLAASQPVLRFGSTGTAVEKLQQLLGSYVNPIRFDGDFSLRTLHAVRTFQYRFFLTEDGIVGRKTWETLLSGKPPALPTLQLGSQGQAVTWVQEILTRVGTYASIGVYGQADGVFGAVTRDAVLRYQADRQSLDADGVVGADTWAVLSGDRFNASHHPITGVEFLTAGKRHTGAVSAIATTPGVRFVFTASADMLVQRWNETGSYDTEPGLGDRGAVSDVEINPATLEIISSTFGGTIRTTDFRQTDSSRVTFPGRGGGVNAIDISPSGKLIAAANTDSSVRLFNTSGGLLAERNLHANDVTDVAFNPRRERFEGQLVSADTEQQVIMWEGALDVGSPNLRATFLSQASTGNAKSSVAFSNDGYEIAVAAGPYLRIFSSLGGLLYTVDYGVGLSDVAFSPCGRYLAVASRDNSVWIVDLRASGVQEIDTFAPVYQLDRHTARVTAVAFSEDGTYLYSGDASGELITWKISR